MFLIFAILIFTACAKEGSFPIKMPEIPKSETPKEEKHKAEIENEKLKEDILRLKEEINDLKYNEQPCWDEYYE
jgi:hypothetical protein